MINPTPASSEAAGHSGRFVNDGNPATFWQADPADPNPWLAIDLERITTISSVTLSFPSGGNWRYRVDISDDGNANWKMISDQTQTAGSARTQTLTAAAGARGRFLRVTFVGIPDAKPAALVEMEALGKLSDQ